MKTQNNLQIEIYLRNIKRHKRRSKQIQRTIYEFEMYKPTSVKFIDDISKKYIKSNRTHLTRLYQCEKLLELHSKRGNEEWKQKK